MPEPVLDFESLLAIGLTTAQADYATIQPDSELIDIISGEPGAPQITTQQITNKNHTGKGHSYATYQIKTAQDVVKRLQCWGSLEMIGWALAGAMGDVTTSGTTPNFTHDYDFANAAVSKQIPVFTVYEQLSDGVKQRYKSMAVRSVQFSIRNLELIATVIELTGSGEIVSGAHGDTPALLAQEFPISGSVDVQIADPGGSFTSIADRIVNAEITITPNLIEPRGRRPGSGLYKNREIFSDHSATITVGIEAIQSSADFLGYFLNNTPKALKVIGTINANRNFTLHWPQFRVGQDDLGYQDRLLQDGVTVGPENIFKDTPSASPNVPFEAQVKNGVAGYLG